MALLNFFPHPDFLDASRDQVVWTALLLWGLPVGKLCLNLSIFAALVTSGLRFWLSLFSSLLMLGVGDCQCFIFGSNPICIPGINLTLLTCIDELSLLNILCTIMLQLFMSDTPGPISCQTEHPRVLLGSFQRHLVITWEVEIDLFGGDFISRAAAQYRTVYCVSLST